MGMGDDHSYLVQQVKNIQRQEGGKEKWEQFINSHGRGMKDPKLRTAEELQEFLSSAGSGGWASGPSGDPETMKLIQRVKSGQKTNEKFKEAWETYCLTTNNDIRDPNRHDKASLTNFLAIAPEVHLPEDDPHHSELINRIKNGQRASVEFKNAW